MSDEKAPRSFFRKVVQFVANPATDWADLDKREEARQSEFLKSELKAIVERKKRNDFVRKREFDMLRKLRREGTTDGASTLARLSSMAMDADDSRLDRNDSDIVKQKIDEIEQQMSGEAGAHKRGGTSSAPLAPAAASRRATRPQALSPAERAHAPTEPLPLTPAAAPALEPMPPAAVAAQTRHAPMSGPMALPTLFDEPGAAPTQAAALQPIPMPSASGAVINHLADAGSVEVSEIAHDPELDEAVISFANADFESCEDALLRLIAPGGSRVDVAETWMVLFDLYRAIGKQAKFEALAVDYAHRFQLSPPQWFSLPQLVAQLEAELPAAPASAAAGTGTQDDSDHTWSCPEHLEAQAVATLQSTLLQAPLPWTLDWSRLRSADPQAALALRNLMRAWAAEPVAMKWTGVEALFDTLEELTPTSLRDTDPAFWLLRLEMLRVINQAMRYDEVALDYCITYEVSPPAWEAAACTVEVDLKPSHSRVTGPGGRLSRIGEVSTRYVESELDDDAPSLHQEASLTLSGQLVGDIGPLLKDLEDQLDAAAVVRMQCGTLIRVDFIAAGDLLNWVLARRSEGRQLSFVDANRLVALFFGAMGIAEHAKVGVRHV